MEHITGIYVDE